MLTCGEDGPGLVFRLQGEQGHCQEHPTFPPPEAFFPPLSPDAVTTKAAVSWYWTTYLPGPCSGGRSLLLSSQEHGASLPKVPLRLTSCPDQPLVPHPLPTPSTGRVERKEGRKEKQGTKDPPWGHRRLCVEQGRAGRQEEKVDVYMGLLEQRLACRLADYRLAGETPSPARI